MKKLFTLLVLFVSVFALFSFGNTKEVEAATPSTLYLTPNGNWTQANARFAAYFFGNGEKWVSMTDNDGDGIYEVAVPSGYPKVIFCRMNPSASANNWDNKWNQTSDLTVPTNGTNHYTVKSGTWDKGGGTWSTFGSSEPVEPEPEPETTYWLCGSMTSWGQSDTHKFSAHPEKDYEVLLENVSLTAGTLFKFKEVDPENWYGISNVDEACLSMVEDDKTKDHNIKVKETGVYNFYWNKDSKKLWIHNIASDVNGLIAEYVYKGVHQKETIINLTETARLELLRLGIWHAQSSILNRTTYYNVDELWMTNDGNGYSYYGTKNGNLTYGDVADTNTKGEKVAITGTTVRDHYVLLEEIIAKPSHLWSIENEVYTTTSAEVIELLKAYAAPCYLGFADDSAAANYITLTKVTIQKIDGKLVLRLHAKTDSAKLTDGDIFAQATISAWAGPAA